GNYPIPTLTTMIPNPPITVSGQFNITMTLKESQKEIGCLNVKLCLGRIKTQQRSKIDRGLDVETPHEPYKWHSFQDSQFLWSLCNKTAVPVVVTSLHIEPDPIQFGHNISFSGQIDVFEDVGTTKTLEAHLKVMMKLDTQWFDVCVYKPEYCNINDGNYPIPTLTKMVPNPPITVSGRFDITMTLTESQKEIGCLNVQLCLGQC
ncbi:hypothetical protein MAR_024379, partial [Mya arenaria]